MSKDRYWIFPPTKRSVLWNISSRCVLGAVGLTSKFWLEWVNKLKVFNKDILYKAIYDRPKGKALLTVSNHDSCLDDPVLWGCLKVKTLSCRGNHCMRWTLAADDICFTKYWHAMFFSLGHCIPVTRGNGVYQKGMDFMLEKMNKGDWVHMFPEGKVNMTNEFMRLKWGVGRLISECKIPPLVIPMHHFGMVEILPNTPPYIPRIRKKVTLLIGNPMDFSIELEKLKALKKTPKEIRKHITDMVQEEFARLREITEALHIQHQEDR